jgi:predicted amidohydrolase
MNRRNFLSSTAALAAAGPSGAAQHEAPRASHLHVAACQILTFPEPAKSAQKICAWLEKAAAEKIDVVAFPEAALCGYNCDPEYWKQANPRDFEAAERTVVDTARKLNIAAVVGSAHWEEGKVYDSVLAIDRDGQVRGRYAKTYLAEKWPTPGRKMVLLPLAGVKSSFIICHDVRYPELVRLPAIAGAQICYLCSNESGLLEEHKLSAYRAMPIARATENSIFVVMSNAPADPDHMRSSSQSHGNSKIIHPDGNVLAEAGFFKETLVSATIDLKAANRAIANRSVVEGTMISGWLRDGSRLVVEEKP